MPNDFYAELLVNEFFKVKDVVTTTQYIFNLKIVPGVNSVKVSFETLQPTIPVITCTASDGSVAFAFPLFGGMRTKHVGILGEHKPLQQDTPHTLKIVAAGTNRHGQRIEKQVTTNFRTGSREATVMFDTIKVRNDSDTSSNGELRLFFSVGDLESGTIIGQPLVWPYLDISDRDQPFDMNLSTVIPRAPRRLWVSVNAFDDDNNPLFPSFDQFTEEYLQAFTSFKGEGSTGGSNSSYDWANITRVFDIDSIGAFASSDQTFRIDLPTGNFALAYTITGRIRVTTVVPPEHELRLAPYGEFTGPLDLGLVGKPKMTMQRSGGDQRRYGYYVGLGAEGSIYYKPVTFAPTVSEGEWTRVPGEPHTPVKAFTGRDGRLNLFAYDGDGGVLYNKPGATGEETPWTTLGGRVSGVLAVTEGPAGEADVFGLGEGGVVYHTRIGANGEPAQDWQRIGEGVSGSLSAFSFADGTVALFALGRDGEILHKQRRRDQWNPGRLEWHSLGRKGGERLFVVQPAKENVVVIGALAEDESLRYLEWPEYPEGDPARRWHEVGTIDQWLDARPPRIRGRDRRAAGDARKAVTASSEPDKREMEVAG